MKSIHLPLSEITKSKNMKTLQLTLLVLVLASFIGCTKEPSASVAQEKIHTTYELFYDKNTDKTTVKAWFRFSNATGTLLQLSQPSDVRFNNEPLVFDSLFAYYKKEYSGSIQSGTIVFTDINNKVFQNTLQLPKPVAFPENFTTVSKSASYTLSWLGDPVGQNEAVGIGMGSASAISGNLFNQPGAGATSIILEANKLQSIATTNGQVICVMDRYTLNQPQQAPAAGGVVKGTYRTLNKTITLQ
ncbi:hypothetical protein EG028_01820 [Chitinophaga barathri]|uniref:Lipoprotein n=2 Tax=Chitinophaga barathri TaxID=1647451 RepID=A0A3N4N5Z3_9BACT|nr:hypothetical protein EG028_01820 [Chitinophaga barathri]